MTVAVVEQRVGASAVALDTPREEDTGNGFESSLLEVLDSGAEFESEASREPGDATADDEVEDPAASPETPEDGQVMLPELLEEELSADALLRPANPEVEQILGRLQGTNPEPSAPTVEVVNAGEGEEQAGRVSRAQAAGGGAGVDSPPVSDRAAQPPEPGEARSQAALGSEDSERSRSTSSQPQSESARPAVAGVETPASREPQQIDSERQQDIAQATQRQAAASQQTERPEVEQPRPGPDRPQNVGSERVQTPADPQQLAGAAHKGVDDSRSGSDEERSLRDESRSREALAARRNAQPEASQRTEARDEILLESQTVRSLAAVTASIEGPADPALVDGAAAANTAPIEPAVEIAEPNAPASTARPMPPEAIPQHIEWLVARGGGTAEIQLHPPELGKLSIQVRVHGDQVQVVVNVQESSAQTVVAEYRDALESGLSSKDLKLDQFEVRDWANRDDTSFRENQSDPNRDGAEGHESPRDRGGRSLPRGVAGALAPPIRGNEPTLGDEGINLHV